MARVEIGFSNFLFGSFSAFYGSEHGVPRRPPPRCIQAAAVCVAVQNRTPGKNVRAVSRTMGGSFPCSSI